MVGLGTSLVVNGTASFAPASGGPVTLATGAPTVDGYSTLTGTDRFAAGGPLTLGAAATLSTSGAVDAYGGLTIDLWLNGIALDGTTLNNHAAATLDGTFPGAIILTRGAAINNLAGASFAVIGVGAQIYAGDGSAVAFNNAGALTGDVVGGGGAGIGVPFVNAGSVVVLQGGLSLGGAGVTTSSGSFTAAAGTNLNLTSQDLSAGSVISSDGFVSIDNSTEAGSFRAAGGTYVRNTSFTGTVVGLGSSIEVNGTASFAPASGGPVTLATGALTVQYGAALTGTDSIVADGLVTLGTLSTLSTTGAVDAYGGLALAVGVTIAGTALDNHAAATWDIAADLGSTLESGAVINNLAGATFAVVGAAGTTARFNAGDGSAVAFDNAGALTCSTAGLAGIGVPFSNSGSVAGQRGELDLGGAGASASGGTFTGAAGTALRLDGQDLTAGSIVSTDGSVVLSNCVEAGSFRAAGGTSADGTSFTGTVGDLGPSLRVGTDGRA